MKIVYPSYFQIVRREPGAWLFWQSNVFCRFETDSITPSDAEQVFGLTRQQITIELFRINGGKLGYYLANLRDKKYYYCGSEFSDIKTTLLSLGIGRSDPQDYQGTE